MVYLSLSILFSSVIFVIFKLFAVYKIDTLYAIIINYVVASCVGMFFYEGQIVLTDITHKSWFWGAAALGLLFIVTFNLMAATSQKLGVSVASVATKMSLAIPVLFGVLVYKEELGSIKIAGILLALAAVYFASIKEKSKSIEKSSLVLPGLVFLGSGIIDTSLKFFQENYVKDAEFPLFSAVVFAFAGIIGIIYMGLKSMKGTFKPTYKNSIAGICLGVPNYFSIYFLLKALRTDGLNSSQVFTINNVAIVMFSTLLGIWLFREKISLKNGVGIVLAIFSIVLVALF